MKNLMVGLLLSVMVGSAHAGLIEVTASDSGWYDSTGYHSAGNSNYIVGGCCGSNLYRNFFTFDLSGIADTVYSAALQVYTYHVSATGIYDLYDVATSTASLTTSGTGQVGIYNDLGTGFSYGSTEILSTDDYSLIQIDLTSSAIDDINSAIGSLFAIGGEYSLSGNNQFAFGYSGSHVENKLILTTTEVVSEPATLAMFGLGLMGLCFARRSKRA